MTMALLLQPSDLFDLSRFAHSNLFQVEHVWLVLPNIESYVRNLKLGELRGTISPSAYLVNPESISIGEGSVVEPGAYIQGPCWIGKNCTIRHGAYIRGSVLTGDHCVIGHDTEVKNAVFLNHAHAAHFAYVGDSILGNYVNLGAGTKCANFKLDQGKIAINYEGQKIATGLRKFGAIIGDYTQLGCNSVTNPGTIIGSYVRCYPCVNFGGVIPSHSVIKSEARIQVKKLTLDQKG